MAVGRGETRESKMRREHSGVECQRGMADVGGGGKALRECRGRENSASNLRMSSEGFDSRQMIGLSRELFLIVS